MRRDGEPMRSAARFQSVCRAAAALAAVFIVAMGAAPSSAEKIFTASDANGMYRYASIGGEIFSDGDSEVYSGVGMCTFSMTQVTFYDTYQRMNSKTVDTESGQSEDYYITDNGEIHIFLTPNGESADEEYIGVLSDTIPGALIAFTSNAGELDLTLGFKQFPTVTAWDSGALNGDWFGIEMNITGNPNPAFGIGFDSTTFNASDSSFRFSFWEPGVPADINKYGGFFDVVTTNGLVKMTAMSSTAGNTNTLLGWISPDSQALIYSDVGDSSLVSIGILLKRPSINTTFDTASLFGSYPAIFFALDVDNAETIGAGATGAFFGSFTFDGQGGGEILLPGDADSGEPAVFIEDLTYAVDQSSGTAHITVTSADGTFSIRAAYNDSRTILVGAAVDTGTADLERFAFIAILDPTTVSTSIGSAGDSVDLKSDSISIAFGPGTVTGGAVNFRVAPLSDSSAALSDTKNVDASVNSSHSRIFKGIEITPGAAAKNLNETAVLITINFTPTDLKRLNIDTSDFTEFSPMYLEADTVGKKVWKRVPSDSIVSSPSGSTLTYKFNPPSLAGRQVGLSAKRKAPSLATDTFVNDRTETSTTGRIDTVQITFDTDATFKYLVVTNKRWFMSDSVSVSSASVGNAGCTIHVAITARGDSMRLYVNSNAAQVNIGVSAPDTTRISVLTETSSATALGYPATDTGTRAYRLVVYEVEFRDTANNIMTDLASGSTRYSYIMELQLSDAQVNNLVRAGGDTQSLYLFSATALNGSYSNIGALTYVSDSSAKNKRVFRSSALTTASAKAIGITSSGGSSGAATFPSACVLRRVLPFARAWAGPFRAIRDRMLSTAAGRAAVSAYYSLSF